MSYGKDPNLITPTTPWKLSLSLEEQALIQSLSDLVLQLPKEFLASSQIGIVDFFDEFP